MATFNMCTRLARSVYCSQSNILRTSMCNSRIAWRHSSEAAGTETKAEEGSTKSEAPTEGQGQMEKAWLAEKDKLTAEKDKLSSQFGEVQDKYRRSLAEMENVRQRMQKQVNDAKLFGIQGFCKDLLEVADILGKATETVPKEELNKGFQALDDLFSGLTMTESQLQKVFTRHGLLQINPSNGDPFDPNVHEALFQLPLVEGKDSGTVGAVTKIGYKLHERTVRPALVGVYK